MRWGLLHLLVKYFRPASVLFMKEGMNASHRRHCKLSSNVSKLNLLGYFGDNRVRRDVRASVSFCLYSLVVSLGTQAGGSGIKNPPASAGDAGLIPGSGRFSGGGNANLL